MTLIGLDSCRRSEDDRQPSTEDNTRELRFAKVLELLCEHVARFEIEAARECRLGRPPVTLSLWFWRMPPKQCSNRRRPPHEAGRYNARALRYDEQRAPAQVVEAGQAMRQSTVRRSPRWKPTRLLCRWKPSMTAIYPEMKHRRPQAASRQIPRAGYRAPQVPHQAEESCPRRRRQPATGQQSPASPPLSQINRVSTSSAGPASNAVSRHLDRRHRR